MRETDWRGNEYGVGDLVIYARMSGRCVEMVEARVLDIWRVFRNDDWKWERLPDGTRSPKLKGTWNYETRSYDDIQDPDDELRVKLQPTGKGSRFRSYTEEFKPVTLTITENVTKISEREEVND